MKFFRAGAYTVWTVNDDVVSWSTPFIELSRIHALLTGWIDKGVDRFNSNKGVDRLKTSLTVHAVYLYKNSKIQFLCQNFKHFFAKFKSN